VFHVKLELIGREGSSVRCLDREGVLNPSEVTLSRIGALVVPEYRYNHTLEYSI